MAESHPLEDLLCSAISHQVKAVLFLLLLVGVWVGMRVRCFLAGLDVFSLFFPISFFLGLDSLCLGSSCASSQGFYSALPAQKESQSEKCPAAPSFSSIDIQKIVPIETDKRPAPRSHKQMTPQILSQVFTYPFNHFLPSAIVQVKSSFDIIFVNQPMNSYALVAVAAVLFTAHGQSLELVSDEITHLVDNNTILPQFQVTPHMDCGMPELFIFPDRLHQTYTLHSSQLQITSVQGLWLPLPEVTITCSADDTCQAAYSHQCTAEQHDLNRIRITTQLGPVEYLVDCSPDQFYKPFELGLLLLIALAAVTLTLSSAYSLAWSYKGYGYTLTNTHVYLFNVLLVIAIALGYSWPKTLALGARVVGSMVGAAGVGVCLSEILWLTKKKSIRQPILKQIRVIDVISHGLGLLCIPIYWLFNGHWLINDIMALCSTIALMKLLKIKSLSTGVFLLISLLLVQSAVGVAIHYIFKLSYNNFIVNLLQNPAIIVMPSITKQLYRQCAWLPITCVLFPGLLLSYLRRFDRSRSTHLYFIIGLVSFYAGSMLWMAVDLETVHSLPFSIFSQPATIIIICLHSYRRNEFSILWSGIFHDEELMEGEYTKSVIKQTEIISPSAYVDLTDNLRITHENDSSDQYRLIVD